MTKQLHGSLAKLPFRQHVDFLLRVGGDVGGDVVETVDKVLDGGQGIGKGMVAVARTCCDFSGHARHGCHRGFKFSFVGRLFVGKKFHFGREGAGVNGRGALSEHTEALAPADDGGVRAVGQFDYLKDIGHHAIAVQPFGHRRRFGVRVDLAHDADGLVLVRSTSGQLERGITGDGDGYRHAWKEHEVACGKYGEVGCVDGFVEFFRIYFDVAHLDYLGGLVVVFTHIQLLTGSIR